MKILFVTHYMSQVEYFSTLIGEFQQRGWKVEVYADFMANFPKGKSWIYTTARRMDTYFFYKYMPQSKYYKKRMIVSYPLWLKFIIFTGLINLFSHWKEKILDKDAPLPYVIEHLKKVNPDIVIGGPLTIWENHLDGEFIKAAKLLNIPTIGLVHTWDNLTTKHRIHPIPDLMFAWNKYQKEELEKYHGIPSEKIKIVGAFPFERWLYLKPKISKELFCGEYGLNPKLPIITYIGSSKSICPDQEKELKRFLLSTNAQVIFRSHPNNFINVSGVKTIPDSSDKLLYSDKRLAFHTFYYSDYVVGISTSAMIEALMAGAVVQAHYVDNKDTQVNSIHFNQIKPFLGGAGGFKEKFLGLNQMPSKVIADHIVYCFP